jgi:aminoglycoside phosphotransferase (APT) family kinase protein
LRGYTQRTAALVARVEAFGRSLTPTDLPGNDIVHWDLHPGNLLVRGDELTAVIDTDFVTCGDASFDLVTFAFASAAVECDPAVRERLWTWVESATDETRRQTYLAHLLIRFLDWPIRCERSRNPAV